MCSTQVMVVKLFTSKPFLHTNAAHNQTWACQRAGLFKIATARLIMSAMRFQIHEFDVLHKLCLEIAPQSTASKFLVIYPKTFLNTYATPNQRLTKDSYATQLCFSVTSLAGKIPGSTSNFQNPQILNLNLSRETRRNWFNSGPLILGTRTSTLHFERPSPPILPQ